MEMELTPRTRQAARLEVFDPEVVVVWPTGTFGSVCGFCWSGAR
jgi:hypothetical protein